MDVKNPKKQTIVAVFDLLILNFLAKDKLIGSINANIVVTPAKKTHKKNAGPIIYATSPIILNISGNTTNINPVPDVAICSIPSPVFSDINPSMLNTPIAVIISKLEFDAATTKTLSTR